MCGFLSHTTTVNNADTINTPGNMKIHNMVECVKLIIMDSDTPTPPTWGMECVWCGVGRCEGWVVGGGEGRSVLALGCGGVGWAGVWERDG
jgi:hypothetical protein